MKIQLFFLLLSMKEKYRFTKTCDGWRSERIYPKDTFYPGKMITWNYKYINERMSTMGTGEYFDLEA